ncbi:MAG: PilZ domain-containing protein [Isosphaeraceae bacterium]|jgi:hypothetical protein|nr:PilZ domain-containing protein [Isosphaeraceae bacterium]
MQERRRFERVPYFCRLTVEPLPSGPASEAYAVDIGLGGVGIASTQRLEVGQAIAITFHLNVGGSPATERTIGEIRNIRFEEGANRVGVEFRGPLDRSLNPLLVKVIERI